MNYIVSDIRHYCNVSLNKCSAIKKHIIDYYDFTFVTSGSITYEANGKKYTLKRNDAIFLKPQSTRARYESDGPVSFVSFNFKAAAGFDFPFDDYMENCITRDIRNLISVFPHSHLMGYYHSKEKIANILNYILLELSDSLKIPSNNMYVTKIINYIDQNITKNISLSSISDYVNITKEYACSVFKKETGKSIISYMNEKKIRLAKDLISTNEMSLKDVAEYLGYKNYNYFSRLFRKYFDISPIAVKIKHR